MERAGVKRRLRNFLEICRVKRREVPNAIAKAVKLAEELIKQGIESKAEVANDVAPVKQFAVEFEVVLLSANLKKTHKEAASFKE